MRALLSWLREFVPVEADPDEIAERLSLAGLHVDEVARIGGGVRGVVVGEVRAIRDHPDADSLVLVTVDAGAGAREIVCGARNFAPGDLVPVALPGARLPGDLEIARRTVRGVVSEGMLCSARELGIGDDHSGILVLDGGAPLGADAAAVLGLEDVAFDIDVTPNRPDALSIVGVAREIAALYGLPLSVPAPPAQGPAVQAPPAQGAPALGQDADAADLVSVRVADRRGCPRYLARVVTGVRVGPSPWWVRRRLWASGMRPISNVVDATNYVLLERGHPLHAFDRARLAGPAIVVRAARAGETMTTLDGASRALARGDVLICDAARPVAIAGIMGGADTEVSPGTTEIVLESAYFDPRRIARTSRRLGLRTEASIRFERGADPEGVGPAADRTAALIAELAGGRVARGAVDVYPAPVRPRRITVKPSRVNALLGIDAAADSMAASLEAIGCSVESTRSALRIQAPSFRPDLVAEEDVLEEVARLHGFDRIPSTLPRIAQAGALTRAQALRRAGRAALIGAGLSEAQTLSLVPAWIPERLGLPAEHPWRHVARLANPLSEEESVLRGSLVPGLLFAAARNVARRTTSVALFEAGEVFSAAAAAGGVFSAAAAAGGAVEGAVEEHEEVAWVLTGPAPVGWHGPQRALDFFDGKGVLEAFLGATGVDEWDLVPLDAQAPWHPGRAAAVRIGGTQVGVVAELHPRAASALDLDRVAVGWLALAPVVAAAAEFRPVAVPRFPPARRDIAIIVPEGTPVAEVSALVGRAGAPLLESAPLFDVYRGERIPAGTAGLAFALWFRDPERTLTDAEVSASFEAIASAVRDAGWRVRE